jgi:hypothetical protein
MLFGWKCYLDENAIWMKMLFGWKCYLDENAIRTKNGSGAYPWVQIFVIEIFQKREKWTKIDKKGPKLTQKREKWMKKYQKRAKNDPKTGKLKIEIMV